MAAGHGGQVLLSHTTCELVRHNLPDGVTVRDLGIHAATRDRLGAPLSAPDRALHTRYQAALPPPPLDRQGMTLDEAVAYALELA